MKTTDFRNMTNEELNEKLKSLKTELFNLRFSQAIRQLQNPLMLNTVRKDIAKVKTILRERELNITKGNKA